jgi:hypothetical protein
MVAGMNVPASALGRALEPRQLAPKARTTTILKTGARLICSVVSSYA